MTELIAGVSVGFGLCLLALYTRWAPWPRRRLSRGVRLRLATGLTYLSAVTIMGSYLLFG